MACASSAFTRGEIVFRTYARGENRQAGAPAGLAKRSSQMRQLEEIIQIVDRVSSAPTSRNVLPQLSSAAVLFKLREPSLMF